MPNLRTDENQYLYYKLIQGDAHKPCLVFLHEGLGCEAMWKGFPELLCKIAGSPGLVYDRLGYGKSSPLRNKRTINYLHEYALELSTLLEAVIPGKPFILIGHSDGGSIALIYGAKRPFLLKAIITEAAHVFVEPETLAGIKVAERAWEKGMLRSLLKYHGDKTETIFRAWSETWLSKWFADWNIENLLPDIQAPLLIIQGADDQYGTKDQVHSIVSKSSGYVRDEIVEKCGHAPHLESQTIVLEIMSDFISQIK